MTRRTSAFVMAVSGAAVLATVVARAGQRDNYCATQPPPQGLVERCRAHVMIVPDDKGAFQHMLTEWMRTCVTASRAASLVYDNPSVDAVWGLVEDLPGYRRAVRIYPRYEPLTFKQDGKTCYGVDSVTFSTTKTPTVVDTDDDDITISSATPDDIIKEAATDAKQALARSTDAAQPKISQLLGALDAMAKYGKDFDDTYFPVAPYLAVDPMKTPAACFTDFDGGKYTCLPPDAAVKSCARHLAQDVVAMHYENLTPKRFTEILEIKADDIQRGLHYLEESRGESEPAFCEGLTKGVRPKVTELNQRGKTTLYGHY